MIKSKRVFDVLVSVLLLIALCPLFLIIGLVVVMDSRGNVLFLQKRIGLNGKEFCIIKFRSMRNDGANTSPYYTVQNDTRVTAVGRLIRLSGLDELPQLVNVFLGDMSLIGPRPDVIAQRGLYTPIDWSLRHTVRPGITGLAQSSYRSKATVSGRRRLDLFYVKNINFCLDLKIICMTINQLFKGSGN